MSCLKTDIQNGLEESFPQRVIRSDTGIHIVDM